MRYKNLDLNLLVALDLLMAERNVSRAAEKMHISQSAMSNALSRLRDYFGDDLLVQSGRKMELTPRAEVLRVPVRDILVRVDASIATAPEFDPGQTDRMFRVYVSDYTLATLVPRLLRRIAGRGFGVRFDFRPQTDIPQRTLESGEADLLIIPEPFASPEHPTRFLYEEQFVCIADRNHPRIGDRLDRDTYCRERHVVMQPAMRTVSYETVLLAEKGIERSIDVTTYSFASLAHLVAGTDRLATVHERLAIEGAAHLPIRIHPLPFALEPMRQVMQWHVHRSNDPAILWLRETLCAVSVAAD